MSVASHDLFNMKLRTCIDTGKTGGLTWTEAASDSDIGSIVVR